MRKTMLSTAALALLLGVSTAVAQQSGGDRPSGGQARGAGEQGAQAQAPSQPIYDPATNRMTQPQAQSAAQQGQQQPRQGAQAQGDQQPRQGARAQGEQQPQQGARAQEQRQQSGQARGAGEQAAQGQASREPFYDAATNRMSQLPAQSAERPARAQQQDQQPRQRAQTSDRQPRVRAQTTGQGPQEGAREPRQTQRQLEPGARAAETTGQASQEGRDGQAQRGRTAQEGARASSDARGTAGVSLNEQQRTRISSLISRQDVRPLSRVNFSVSVGAVVPRSVRLHPLSADIVAVVPQFRDHRFFVVEDEIVIVEPSTLRIAAVIPRRVATAPTARSMAQAPSRVQLTRQQRESIRTHALRDTPRIATQEQVVVGAAVPAAIELRTFPETIVTDVPTVRPFRFFVHDAGDVVLVDPAESRVVEVIR